MQCCSVTQLRDKEVISSSNGCRIGYVSDVEINMKEGCLTAILIYGKRGGFGGMFGKEEDIRIPWKDIDVIGEDTILVRFDPPPRPPQPQKGGLFSF